MENGILAPKAQHEMFVQPIHAEKHKSTLADSGTKHQPGAPVICSEFGGVNIAPAKDSAAAGERDWGYTTASDPDDFLDRFEKLVRAIVKGGHSHGLVYTQLYALPFLYLFVFTHTDLKQLRYRARGQWFILDSSEGEGPFRKSQGHYGRCARLLL